MSTESNFESAGPAPEQGMMEPLSELNEVCGPQPAGPQEIRIGMSRVPAEAGGHALEVDIFTMALGDEAIYLLPLKTWSQLDIHKWRVQGKLPGTPAGLEIAVDHVKIAGESVSTSDPEACAKLERAFNAWLALERAAVEQAAQKAQSQSGTAPVTPTQEEPMRFEVGLDQAGQAHIRCFEGKEKIADVACTTPGITSLLNQGLMRKPGSWKVGALRDWLELDGELFRFKDASNGVVNLQNALNERYHPAAEGGVHDVKVFPNPASESGFDIQFPASDNGLMENKRRHLDPAAIDLLSDPQRCRVLRKGIVIKFTPPTFVFKQQTQDGGERELEQVTENVVPAVSETGETKWLDLSQPISHLGLGAAELTAIFNHPSLNRRAWRNQTGDWSLDKAA